MNKKNKSLLKAILPWVLVLVIIGSIIPVLTNRNAGNETLTYSEFTKALEDEKIKEVTVKPQSYVVDVTGKYTKKVDGKNKTVSFSTLVPATDEEVDSLMQVIKDQGVKAKVADASDDNMVINIIMNLIPYIILIGGMVFLFKYMNAAGGGNAKAFEFGNSRAKLEKNEKTRFSDVAGADEEKEEVKELVDFLKNPKRFADMGIYRLLAPEMSSRTLVSNVESFLAPLLEGEHGEEDRALLMETAVAYVRAYGNLNEAAERLYCHKNTVRYRLRRIHEILAPTVSEEDFLECLNLAVLVLTLSRDSWEG